MQFVALQEKNKTKNQYAYGKPLSFRSDSPKFHTKIEEEYESMIRSGDNNYESAHEALCAAVDAFIGGSGSIGVDLLEMSPGTKEKLSSSFPDLKIKKANETFRFLRMVKSTEELRRLETSSSIVEKSLEDIIERIRPGVSEIEVKRTFIQSVVANGGMFEEGHFMVPHGSMAGAMTTPTNEVFVNNSSGWLDCGCTYQGYFSDIGESFALGHVDEKVSKVYEVLNNVIEHCEQVVSPGMRCSELNAEALKIWDRSGVSAPPTGMGHGLGLEVHEYPRISAAKGDAIRNSSAIKDDIIEASIDIPFEDGMVLAIEAPYMKWGWGGVHVERNIVVGKNGSKRLSNQPRHLRRIDY